ncbi:MAG: terminase small subunit [Rhodospirillales bacterium]|jgi:hypothetical protein|nr:hypothetical protein [Rhodospirillaceae bacterium]MDP6429144.1 terminase small subunit [Rhodospirillales bacterium]MDP6645672.1 terminase small subunit [Rhodospirillales bacterium]
MTLNSRQEAFCRAYAIGAGGTTGAAGVNGARAARQAGYEAAHAAKQASRLLQNAEVAGRIDEFHAEQAAARAEAAEKLIDKLEPVYRSGLDAGDTDTVLQVVELQARIAGLLAAGFIRPRAQRGPLPARPEDNQGHMEFLGLLDGGEGGEDAENVPG